MPSQRFHQQPPGAIAAGAACGQRALARAAIIFAATVVATLAALASGAALARAEKPPPPPAPTAATPAATPAKRPAAEPAPAASATAADRAEARALYESTCVTCHGPEGKGDGLAATGLPAKPASFADPRWQQRTSDEAIARAILGGGAAIGKSPLMPPNPQLAEKPGVVAAMRDLLRGFAAPAATPAAR